MSAVSFPVFNDGCGNRFIFPSIFDDGEKAVDWAQCMTLRLALGIKEEPERLSVDADEKGSMSFPHVKSEMTHPSFLHGAATVYLIGGPEFEAAAKGDAQRAEAR